MIRIFQAFMNKYFSPEPNVVDANDSDLDFERSLAFVFKWEGGYVDDPSDGGGKTRFGISHRSFPTIDIQSLTKEKAAEIYREHYWDAAGCNRIDWPLNLVVFDTAVNMGVGRATTFLKKTDNPQKYLDERVAFYLAIVQRRPNQKKFLKGWLSRVADLRKEAGVP